jgi:hypothetical protein
MYELNLHALGLILHITYVRGETPGLLHSSAHVSFEATNAPKIVCVLGVVFFENRFGIKISVETPALVPWEHN